MPSRAAPLALAIALLGCRSDPPASQAGLGPQSEQTPVIGVTPDFKSQPLTAAGLEIDVPATWRILPDSDPHFAMAFDTTHRQPSACSVERRRQGLGPLPSGTRVIDEGPGRRGYMRGAVRGIVQETQASDGATLIVHCRARRTDTKLWREVVVPVLASQRTVASPVEPNFAPTGVVDLCSAAPIVPSYVCALREDGAVYCGPTDGALDRVATSPAAEIGCRGLVACARTDSGAVTCWIAGQAPLAQPELAGARDLVDSCVVDASGAVVCMTANQREGGYDLARTPLHAFDDPGLAITGARAVMAGSGPEQGCIVADESRDGTGIVCWDERGNLPVRFSNPPIGSDEATGRRRQAPESIDPRTNVAEVRAMSDRLCTRTAVGGEWSCTTPDGVTHEVAGCDTKPCGCSLLPGNRVSCEDEPEANIDGLAQARLADVTLVASPCAVLRDGGVVCRVPGATELRAIELRESPP